MPLQLSSGRVYGTLCAASEETLDDLRERDVAFMRVLARLLADALERPAAGAPRWLDGGPCAAVEHDGRVAHLAFWVVATPRAVRAARRAIDCLAEWIPKDRMRDLQMIVSELVTNSVRHAGLEPRAPSGSTSWSSPVPCAAASATPGSASTPPTCRSRRRARSAAGACISSGRMARSWEVVRPATGGVEVSFDLELT